MDEASMQYGFGMFWDMLVRCCVFSVWGQCRGPGCGWVLQGKSGHANSFGFEGWEVGRCGDVRADAGGARAGLHQDTNSFNILFHLMGGWRWLMHWQGCLVLASEVGGWCHVVP